MRDADPEAALAELSARLVDRRPTRLWIVAASRPGSLQALALHPLELPAGLPALRDADPRLGGDLRLRPCRAARDQREVDATADDADVVDLDGHLVAELDRLAGLRAGEPHVDFVVGERLVAERLELDQAFDERLRDL